MLHEQFDQAQRQKELAQAEVAALNQQLSAQDEALQRAQAACDEQQARAKELEEEHRQARAEIEQVLLQMHQLQDELEKLSVAEHEKAMQVAQLHEGNAVQAKKMNDLEANLAMLQEESADAQQQKTLAQAEIAAVNQQLSAKCEALQRANLACEEQKAWLKAMDDDQQKSREELDSTQLQLQEAQAELEKMIHGIHERDLHIEQLQEANASQGVQKNQLVAQLQENQNERDEAQREKDAASARIADLNRQILTQNEVLQRHEIAFLEQLEKVETLESEQRQALEEKQATLLQLHQAEEELEHYFHQTRAIGQLAEAQHMQLQRSQSVMSRLIINGSKSRLTQTAFDVEVLPADRPMPKVDDGQTEAFQCKKSSILERASALLRRNKQ